MMNYTKAEIEKAIGDRFIEWFNGQTGSNFEFLRHGDDPPDLIYVSGERILPVEIVEAYIDQRDATFHGKIRRGEEHSGVLFAMSPDDQLLKFIQSQIEKKCGKPYTQDCILVVYINARLITFEQLESMLPELKLPEIKPFAGIYLTGDFGISITSQGGYRAWKLYERVQ